MKSRPIRSAGIIFASMLLLILAGFGEAESAMKKVLRVAVPNFEAEVFDPTLHTSSAMYQFLIYPELVGGDLHGAGTDTRTGLAYKWEGSPDSKTWTFYLRKDAKWWDGTPITAHDVKFSIPLVWGPDSRVSKPDVLQDPLGGKNADEEIKWRIEIIDDYTIRFHLKESSFIWPELLSRVTTANNRIVPKHWVEKNGKAALAKGSMGGGPYKLVEHIAGTLQRFKAWPEHPFRQPIYEECQYLAVPEESTRLAMLKKGEIDVGEFSYELLPELKKAGFSIINKPTGLMFTMLFLQPYQDPVLAKKEVRRAIMMAINKEAFNKAFFDGEGELVNDCGCVGTVHSPPGRKPDPIYRPAVPYNLEAAKRIIAKEVPKDYRLRLYAIVRGSLKMEHYEAIQGMLTKAGFNVDIWPGDYKTFQKVWMDGKLDKPGIYMKDSDKKLIYYPTIYASSPEHGGRYSVIKIPPTVKVHPDISKADLESLKDYDDLITDRLMTARNWNEYWQAYSDLMDRCAENISPGSGIVYTYRIFAARPEVMPKWKVTLLYTSGIGLDELLIYPPEYEDPKYHPVEYEGPQKKN